MNSQSRTPVYYRAPVTHGFFAALLFLYMLALPFYILPSGYPQPANVLMAGGILIAGFATLAGPSRMIDQAFFAALCFGLFTFFVNALYYVFNPDPRFMLSSVYYLYNAAIFVFVSTVLIRAPDAARKALYYGIALSLLFEVLLITFVPSETSYRATGSFNSPNQLSYWAILCACTVIVLKYRRTLSVTDYLLLLAGGYVQMLSLSKAGIIIYSLLMLCLLISKAVHPQHRALASFGFMIFFIGLAAGSTGLMERMNEAQSIRAAMTRVQTIGLETDDSFQARGYVRIREHPGYLLLGAGEGGYARFDDGSGERELHSGLATLAFCYGAVGILIFLVFLYSVFKRPPRFFIAMLALVMIFGAVHQNIRFPMFWIFLAAVYGSTRVLHEPYDSVTPYRSAQ